MIASLPLRSVALVVVLLMSLPATAADTELHPIAASIKPQLKDPAKPFVLVIQFAVKDGKQKQFEADYAEADKVTRKQKGNLAYDLSRDAKDPSKYVLYERWASLADLDAHLKSAELKTFLNDFSTMLNGPSDLKVFIPVGE